MIEDLMITDSRIERPVGLLRYRHNGRRPILQQLWSIRSDKGIVNEWRDVPIDMDA